METLCTSEGCARPVYAKTLCAAHYQKARVARTLPESPVKSLPCAHCGELMVNRKTTRAKFCSVKCKQDARSEMDKLARRVENLGRTCEWCGEALAVDAPANALTCSARCGYSRNNHIAGQRAARREARRVAWEMNKPPCAGCGGEIPSTRRPGVKYCSPECKRRAQDARWRAKAPHYMREYLYGITAEDYAAMLEAQGNVCAICGDGWTNGRPHVDHDHATGRVRGLLCGPCNTGLGHFRDDAALLRKAVRYLT